MIPGLVQIADYTCAVMKGENAPPELVGPRVEARKLRQRVLTSAAAPKLTMIVNEAALRQVIGSHKIMAAQLRAMLEVADLPNVRLWVLPFEVAGNAGLNSPFYLMNFRRNMSVVYLESATSNVYLEDASKIDFFRRQASELVKAALDPAASAGFVAKIAKEHDRE